MNEELIKARGTYELLKDELRDLCSQVSLEAKAVGDWIRPFSHCGDYPNVYTTQFKDHDLHINKINRIRENYDKILTLAKKMNELEPFAKK